MKASVRREPAAGASDERRPAHPAGARWQSVALPPEHGSWGLVGEPVVLGLLVAPAMARAVGFGEIAWGVVTVLLVAAGFWS